MYDKKFCRSLSRSPFNSNQKRYKIVEPCRDLSRVKYRNWDSTINSILAIFLLNLSPLIFLLNKKLADGTITFKVTSSLVNYIFLYKGFWKFFLLYLYNVYRLGLLE